MQSNEEPAVTICAEFDFNYYLRMLEKQIPFTFCRWGDGEWISLLGLRDENSSNADKHQYFAEMGEQLHELLLRTPQSNNFQAMQPHALRTLGPHIQAWLQVRNQCNSNKINWHHAEVWNKASRLGVLSELFETTESYHRVVVGPKHLDKLPLDYGVVKRVCVPSKNAFLHLNELVVEAKRIIDSFDDKKPLLFFVSCGMSAALFIDRLGSVCRRRSFTALDMGSVFDPYCGVLSRSSHTAIDPVVLLPLEKYLDEANKAQAVRQASYRFITESRFVDDEVPNQPGVALPRYTETTWLLRYSRIIEAAFETASRMLLVGVGDGKEYGRVMEHVFNVKENPENFVLDYFDVSAAAASRIEPFRGKRPKVLLPADINDLQEKYDLVFVNDVLRQIPADGLKKNVDRWISLLKELGTLVITPLGTPNDLPIRTYAWPKAGLAEARLGICIHSPAEVSRIVNESAEDAGCSILRQDTCYELADNLRSRVFHVCKKADAADFLARRTLETKKVMTQCAPAAVLAEKATTLQQVFYSDNFLSLAEPFATVDRLLQRATSPAASETETENQSVLRVVNAPPDWHIASSVSNAVRYSVKQQDLSYVDFLLSQPPSQMPKAGGLYLINVLPVLSDYAAFVEKALQKFAMVVCHQVCQHSAADLILPPPRLFEFRSPRLYELSLRKVAATCGRQLKSETRECLSVDGKNTVVVSTVLIF